MDDDDIKQALDEASQPQRLDLTSADCKELRAAMVKVMALDPTGATVFAIAHETVFSSNEPALIPSATLSTDMPFEGQNTEATPRTKEWFASQGRTITPKSHFEYLLHRTPDWNRTPSVKRTRSSPAANDPASTPSIKRSRGMKPKGPCATDEDKGEEPCTNELDDEDDIPSYEFLTRS